MAQTLQPLLAASGKTEKFQAPSLDEILSEDGVPHYAYEKTFAEVANTIHMVVHLRVPQAVPSLLQ